MKVSEIGLGSWLTHGEADIIHKAYELGVNFFDTANEYDQGKAEEFVGKVLGQYR